MGLHLSAGIKARAPPGSTGDPAPVPGLALASPISVYHDCSLAEL